MCTLQSTRGIILCDLNETILSPQNKLTVPLEDFSSCIARAQQSGFVVGLCSDSSFQTLTEYAAMFDMKGPLVVEQGAAYALSKDYQPFAILHETKIFPSIRDAFLSILTLQKHDNPYHIICGDANRIVEDPNQFASANNGDIMIAVNGLRQFSFSFFVRRRMDGKWVHDPHKLREIEKVARAVGSFLSTWSDVVIDRNDHYGICIFHYKSTSKTNGVECILQTLGKFPLHMIGDSTADHLELKGVSHYAVANAKVEYKQHCNHIATHPFTEGVIDLIHFIIDHQN